MRKNKGFTLVELLVVMAIIAILASITVPNVIGFIKGARATRALGEISGIETSLTKVLADANRTSLHHLFDPQEIRAMGITSPLTEESYKTALQIYTNTLYAILREGRQVLTDQDQATGIAYASVLRDEVISRLGTNYMEVGQDPWGNLYNIWPGPWGSGTTTNPNPIPFRTFQVEAGQSQVPGTKGGAQMDNLSFNPDRGPGFGLLDVETGLEEKAGYAAPRGEIAYIWSNGANLVSGQALYRNAYDSQDVMSAYDTSQESHFLGGGDDVNNWDNGTSWSRFY